MQTSRRTSLGAAIIVGCLVAGSTVGAAAQEEWLPSPLTTFYGTWENLDLLSDGTETIRSDGLIERHDWTFEADMGASDPHMAGTVLASADCLEDPMQGGRVCSVTYVLTNDVGSWLGESTSVPGLGSGDVIFTGRGGYDGFTAHIEWRADNWVWDGDFSDDYQAYAFQGILFHGEMPPFPEPPIE
jgi:hypothetical protein